MEKKAHMGNELFTRGKGPEAKRVRDDAARQKQEGIQGQWQQESPFSEVLELARRNEGVGCSSEIMHRSCLAMRDSRWEEFKRRMRGKRDVISMDPWNNTRSLLEGGKRRSGTFQHCAGNPEEKYGFLVRN